MLSKIIYFTLISAYFFCLFPESGQWQKNCPDFTLQDRPFIIDTTQISLEDFALRMTAISYGLSDFGIPSEFREVDSLEVLKYLFMLETDTATVKQAMYYYNHPLFTNENPNLPGIKIHSYFRAQMALLWISPFRSAVKSILAGMDPDNPDNPLPHDPHDTGNARLTYTQIGLNTCIPNQAKTGASKPFWVAGVHRDSSGVKICFNVQSIGHWVNSSMVLAHEAGHTSQKSQGDINEEIVLNTFSALGRIWLVKSLLAANPSVEPADGPLNDYSPQSRALAAAVLALINTGASTGTLSISDFELHNSSLKKNVFKKKNLITGNFLTFAKSPNESIFPGGKYFRDFTEYITFIYSNHTKEEHNVIPINHLVLKYLRVFGYSYKDVKRVHNFEDVLSLLKNIPISESGVITLNDICHIASFMKLIPERVLLYPDIALEETGLVSGWHLAPELTLVKDTTFSLSNTQWYVRHPDKGNDYIFSFKANGKVFYFKSGGMAEEMGIGNWRQQGNKVVFDINGFSYLEAEFSGNIFATEDYVLDGQASMIGQGYNNDGKRWKWLGVKMRDQ